MIWQTVRAGDRPADNPFAIANGQAREALRDGGMRRRHPDQEFFVVVRQCHSRPPELGCREGLKHGFSFWSSVA